MLYNSFGERIRELEWSCH